MPYQLSANLAGHASDVRSIVAASDDQVFSTSRDSTARSWTYDSSWQPGAVFSGYHEGFVNSSTFVHAGGIDYLVTGGQDGLIQAWALPAVESEPKPAHTLIGHGLNVCCLHADKTGRIVSGSWDMTVKVWRNFELESTFGGHSQAVWAVLAIEAEGGNEELTLTDKLIKLYRGRNEVPLHTFKGHTQPVRALARLAQDRFASAGNDGSIRIWSFDGSALATLDGHDSFVYTLASLPDGSLVSGGEDRSVRIWRANDGQCDQVIVLPAISVWAVATTPSGDIAAGASDGVVRIFTKRLERKADEATLRDYEASVSATAINASQVGDVKKSDLPGLEALARQGKKEGEVLMVKNGANIEAHQWNAAAGRWTKIGDVVDAVGSNRKQLYNGVEYDYVFDVDVKEGSPPLKLPFNANQNPWDAAQKFLQVNELPPSYAEQVVEFIEKNTGAVNLGPAGNLDPFTGAGSYRSTGPAAGASGGFAGDPFTGSGGYRTSAAGPAPSAPIPSGPRSLPHKTPLTFSQANLSAVATKIKQLNDQLAATATSSALSNEELATLDRLPNPPPNAILQKLLSWPAASRFPGLDLTRILNLPDGLIDVVLQSLQRGDAGAKEADTNAMLALRAIANAVARGSLTSTTDVNKVLLALDNVDSASLAKTGKTALATVVLNYSILAVQGQVTAGGVEMISILSRLLQDSDAEVGYRSLVACGNILLSTGLSGSVTPDVAQALQANALEGGKRFTEPRAQQLVAEIAQL